jgi:ferredoxin-type protein NapF
MENLADPARRRLFRGKIHQAPVLRLPWVIDETVFTQQCTQCQDCINVCETQIIVRDEHGFPKVDFSKGECTFCQKCSQSCKEPLFSLPKNIDDPFTGEQKPWPIRLDINNKCLAKNNIYCQSCRDVCEPNAIKFSYIVSGKPSSIPQPSIHLADCIQCGACISNCPQEAIVPIFDVNPSKDCGSAIKNSATRDFT